MNRAGATHSSEAQADCRINRKTQTNRGNDSVKIHMVTIILFNNIYFMYYFIYYNYNIQSRIIWYWNYTRFQFNILYYNRIICLFILILRGSVYTVGDRFV